MWNSLDRLGRTWIEWLTYSFRNHPLLGNVLSNISPFPQFSFGLDASIVTFLNYWLDYQTYFVTASPRLRHGIADLLRIFRIITILGVFLDFLDSWVAYRVCPMWNSTWPTILVQKDMALTEWNVYKSSPSCSPMYRGSLPTMSNQAPYIDALSRLEDKETPVLSDNSAQATQILAPLQRIRLIEFLVFFLPIFTSFYFLEIISVLLWLNFLG